MQTERFPAVWNAMHGGHARVRAGDDRRRHRRQVAGRADPAADPRAASTTSLLVDEDDIEQAILMLLEIEKTVVEGAGAVGLAALLKHRARFAGRKVGLVLCGGNIEPLVLAEIIERGMVKSGRLARLRVDVRDVPGALADVATLLGGSAPTSTRSSTSARSRRCRSSGRRSRSWCRRAASRTSSRSWRRCASRATTPSASAERAGERQGASSASCASRARASGRRRS